MDNIGPDAQENESPVEDKMAEESSSAPLIGRAKLEEAEEDLGELPADEGSGADEIEDLVEAEESETIAWLYQKNEPQETTVRESVASAVKQVATGAKREGEAAPQNSSLVPVMPGRSAAAPGVAHRIKRFFKPDGEHYSRRALIIAGLGVAILFGFLATRMPKQKPAHRSGEQKGSLASTYESGTTMASTGARRKAEPLRAGGPPPGTPGNNTSSSSLSQGGDGASVTRYTANGPMTVTPQPQMPVSGSSGLSSPPPRGLFPRNPAPTADNGISASAVVAATAPVAPAATDGSREESFATRLRAGTPERKSYAALTGSVTYKGTSDKDADDKAGDRDRGEESSDKKAAKESDLLTLPRGTAIPMVLVDPLSTGIPSFVRARVTMDVRNAQREILVPRGSIAQIPFLGIEIRGRIPHDRKTEGFITLPSGEEIILRGTVKGADGLPGIAGVVTKTGGTSFLGRVGRVASRAGSRILSSEVGSAVSTSDVESAIGVEGYGTGLGTYNTRRAVDVSAGAAFTFIVGL